MTDWREARRAVRAAMSDMAAACRAVQEAERQRRWMDEGRAMASPERVRRYEREAETFVRRASEQAETLRRLMAEM